ncbi:hypothetical protein SDC9_132393 [bioreactor metagenome]|uniref:Uncharacterized protein n=1 Tax=bioreactor metagenome TaxID=1076179 RepID=A0A645D7X9_9ZZZZ
MQQRRRADIALHARAARDGIIDIVKVRHVVAEEHITDAITGEREALGIGIGHDASAVVVCHERNGFARIVQLAVRFIRDEVDRMPQLCAFFREQGGKGADRLLAIDHTGGIVGRVDDDRLRVRIDGTLQRGEVDLKMRHIGIDNNEPAARVGCKTAVFRKIRCDGDKLGLIAQRQRAQNRCQRGGCPTGDIEIPAGKRRAIAAVEILRNRVPRFVCTRRAGVAMQRGRIARIQQIDHLLGQRGGRGDGGVADGEIVDA